MKQQDPIATQILVLLPEHLSLGVVKPGEQLRVFEFQFFGVGYLPGSPGLNFGDNFLDICSLRSWNADESWVETKWGIKSQSDVHFSITLQASGRAHVQRVPNQTTFCSIARTFTKLTIDAFNNSRICLFFFHIPNFQQLPDHHNSVLCPQRFSAGSIRCYQLWWFYVTWDCTNLLKLFVWYAVYFMCLKGGMQYAANKTWNQTFNVCLPWVPSKRGSDNDKKKEIGGMSGINHLRYVYRHMQL